MSRALLVLVSVPDEYADADVDQILEAMMVTRSFMLTVGADSRDMFGEIAEPSDA